MSDEVAITPAAVAKGATAALDAVVRLGRARVGGKTLVDAFDPFVKTFCNSVGRGQSLTSAWSEAARAATAAAEATAQLTPKLGRARSHPTRSLGHPDAGAHSLALCARVVAAALNGDRRSDKSLYA